MKDNVQNKQANQQTSSEFLKRVYDKLLPVQLRWDGKAEQ